MTHKYLRSEYQLSPPRWSLIAALTLCLLLTEVEEGSAGTVPSLCSSPIVRDYVGPLRTLPAAEPVPLVLPFGPPEIQASTVPIPKLGPVSSNAAFFGIPFSLGKWLRFQEGDTGFTLRNRSGAELPLNWKIRISLSRVDATGAPSSLISETTTDIAVLGPWASQDISAGPLSEAGTMRIDTSFLDDEGHLLGSYFEYVQVVPSQTKTRLRLSRRALSPGGAFELRVENLGTTEVTSNKAFRVHRFRGNRWHQVLQRRDFLVPRANLPPGHASECQRIRISKRAEPGLYRITKRVGSWKATQGKVMFLSRAVTETFRVTGTR